MNKGIFITGTDTGVGKTFVAVGLIRALKEMGYHVCAMKPVETGCRMRKGRLVPEDTLKLIEAADANDPFDLVNPYRLRNPLAPAVAAELEGVKIRKEKLISAYNKLSDKCDIMIVEGAGGIMVPVHNNYLYRDLIKDLGLPVVIIARPGLGTINHTLLTVEAAKSRGIDVAGVIINCAVRMKKGLSVKSNPLIIEKLTGSPVLGSIPNITRTQTKVFHEIAGELLSRL